MTRKNSMCSHTITGLELAQHLASTKTRCYDNGGESLDRYTVVYKFPKFVKRGTYRQRYYEYVGMNAAPFHPQGIGQHGESNDKPIDKPNGKHLGKPIPFRELPTDCQRLVFQDLGLKGVISARAS